MGGRAGLAKDLPGLQTAPPCAPLGAHPSETLIGVKLTEGRSRLPSRAQKAVLTSRQPLSQPHPGDSKLHPAALPSGFCTGCTPLRKGQCPAGRQQRVGVGLAGPREGQGLSGGRVRSGGPGPAITDAEVMRTNGRFNLQLQTLKNEGRKGRGAVGASKVQGVFIFHPHPFSCPHPSPISVVPEKEVPRFCFYEN